MKKLQLTLLASLFKYNIWKNEQGPFTIFLIALFEWLAAVDMISRDSRWKKERKKYEDKRLHFYMLLYYKENWIILQNDVFNFYVSFEWLAKIAWTVLV